MAGKRRQNHAEHENAERWLLTYADMITLLMAFFIMLYSMSQLDAKKFSAVASAVRAELGGTAVLTGTSGVGTGAVLGQDAAGIATELGPKLAADLQQSVQHELQKAAAIPGLEILSKNGEVTIRLPANALLFRPASAELTPATLAVLARLAPAIAKQTCLVKVCGHTDDLPLHSSRYASAWELSGARASNVAQYLVRHEACAADRCSCLGYADTQPLVPNTCAANRARNRRVEIKLRPLAAAPASSVSTPVTPVTPTGAIAPAPVDLKPQSSTKEGS